MIGNIWNISYYTSLIDSKYYILTTNIKKQRFKTPNRSRKKQPNKVVDTYYSVECAIHMTGDTVQLAFNYLSYKSLSWLSQMCHSYSNNHSYMESK